MCYSWGMKNCDGTHAFDYVTVHPAEFDLGKYQRIVGIPGEVRRLCAKCAEGRLSPRFHRRFAIERPHTCAGCESYPGVILDA